MKSEIETIKTLIENVQYKNYEVDPDIDVLEIGDIVWPETTIGFEKR